LSEIAISFSDIIRGQVHLSKLYELWLDRTFSQSIVHCLTGVKAQIAGPSLLARLGFLCPNLNSL
jgi:hypothetical protein